MVVLSIPNVSNAHQEHGKVVSTFLSAEGELLQQDRPSAQRVGRAHHALSANTHALLKSALTWTPRWRSLLKLDTDGFTCLNSARLIRLRARLEVVYAGLLTYP